MDQNNTDTPTSAASEEPVFHKSLLRQVHKYLGKNPVLTPELRELFSAISDAYDHADEDRELNERSFELSSKELADINHNIEHEVENRTHELQLEHARFIASANSLNDGLIICDGSGNAIVLNRAAKRILDYRPPGAEHSTNLPLTTTNWTTPAMNSRFGGAFNLEEDMVSVMKSRSPVEHRAVQYADRILRIFIAPVLSDEINEGKQLERLGSIIFIEDITERKILERSRDEFFSIASHELRTPLTAIKGNVSMMLSYYEKELTDPSLKEMLSDIYESSGRLIEIVNDFLDVSRIEQGKLTLKIEEFYIQEIIKSVVDEIGTLVKERELELTYSPTEMEALPKVRADRNRTKQVIYNLVGNAVKFTERGKIKIIVSHDQQFIKIWVSDTGRGIPLETQGLLFHKFQQANTSILTRDATRGTGLGLYISKLITEKMGGVIRLEQSAENHGSIFSLTVPVASPKQASFALFPRGTPAMRAPSSPEVLPEELKS